MVQPPTPQTRFIRRYSDEELVEIIPQIARVADPKWPEDVTAAAYDRAREAAGFADSLSARGIQRRWSMEWPAILAMVLDPKRSAAATIRANSKKRRRASRLRLDEVAELLRIVAGFSGGDRLTAAQFDEHVGRLNTTTRRSWLHAAGREALPNSADIDRAFREEDRGGWAVALEAAGLRPPTGLGRRAGISWPDAVARFVDEVGVLPWSPGSVIEFMKQKQLSLEAYTSIQAARVEVVTRWQAEGRGTPPPPPPRGQRPEIAVAAADAGDGPARHPWRRKDTDQTAILEGLVLMYRQLHERGETWTQKRQRAVSARDPRVPGPTFVQAWATEEAKPPTTAKALRSEAQRTFQAELRRELAG